MHTSSPTDSSQSASSPTTSDTPAWPSSVQTAPIRRKPLPQHTRTGSTSTGTSAGASTGTNSSTGYGYTRVRNNSINPAKQRTGGGGGGGGGSSGTSSGPSGSGPPPPAGGKRFYSSPMTDSSPKTPLQEYGLEQREPSIFEDRDKDRSTKLLRRVSHALDDIKEDFSLQLDSRGTADRMRVRRRESAFFSGGDDDDAGPGDGRPPPSTMPSPLGALRNGRPETAASRPLSIFSLDLGRVQGGRRLSRRLSMLGSNLSQKRKRFGESISQPNLIGSSTQM